MGRFSKLSIIILSVTLFNFLSFSKNIEEFNFPEETSLSELSNYTKNGTYGLCYSYNEGVRRENEFIFIWNQKTGKSKFYYSTDKSEKLFAAGAAFNLPEKPLGASYSIKGDYKITFFTIQSGSPIFTILVWDTKNCYSKWYAGSVKQGKISCKTTGSNSAIPTNPMGQITNSDYDIQIHRYGHDYIETKHFINVTEKNSGKGKIYANITTDIKEPVLSLDKSFSVSANLPVKELGSVNTSKGSYGAAYSYSGKQRYSIMWNTLTGASKMYYGPSDKSGFKPVASSYRIPAEPLGEGYKVTGEYKMCYITDDRSITTQLMILVWDTGNGKSQLYYGNIKINKIFKVTSEKHLLPKNPLGIQNAIYNMQLRFDQNKWFIVVWDENTGKSKIYRSYSTPGEYIDLWSKMKGIKPDAAAYDLPVPPVK